MCQADVYHYLTRGTYPYDKITQPAGVLPDIIKRIAMLYRKIPHRVFDKIGGLFHKVAGSDINNLIKNTRYMKAKRRIFFSLAPGLKRQGIPLDLIPCFIPVIAESEFQFIAVAYSFIATQDRH